MALPQVERAAHPLKEIERIKLRTKARAMIGIPWGGENQSDWKAFFRKGSTEVHLFVGPVAASVKNGHEQHILFVALTTETERNATGKRKVDRTYMLPLIGSGDVPRIEERISQAGNVTSQVMDVSSHDVDSLMIFLSRFTPEDKVV